MTMTPEMEVATKYQSHLAPLLACIASTTGPVLEVGVGYFSTPQLHALCGASKRFLISVESDPAWRDEFRRHFSTEDHWFNEHWTDTIRYGVAFIDSSPGGQNRADAFAALISISDYVVVHDYHLDNEDFIRPLLSSCYSHCVCKSALPPTLVASKVFEVPKVLIGM